MKPVCAMLLLGVSAIALGARDHDYAWGGGSATNPRVIILVAKDVDACSCKASTSSAPGVELLYSCGNGHYAQIKVTSPSPSVSAECNADCETSSKQCTAKVEAELVVDDNCLSSPGSVTGPGIGTTNDPCQDVVNGGTYKSKWDLTADCSSVPNTGTGTWMEFRLSACGAAQTNPVLKYSPVLTCDKCTQQ